MSLRAIYDVPAPAKINLFLHVVGRRPDGYHLLESAFMLIDWCDTLHFELRTDGQVLRHDLGVALPQVDLCIRAAQALKARTGSRLGVDISIHKQIPPQAGLGGGSSDAATTLLALIHLWDLKITPEQLMAVGMALGADVPFFLFGKNAWVGGVGEQLQAIELPPARWLVIKPDQGLETARIFADPDLRRDSQAAIMPDFSEHAYSYGQNDLQEVAQRYCPGVKIAMDWLAGAGLQGRMTGSGSAVFAQVLGDKEIDMSSCPFAYRFCENLQAHPLWGWAQAEGLR